MTRGTASIDPNIPDLAVGILPLAIVPPADHDGRYNRSKKFTSKPQWILSRLDLSVFIPRSIRAKLLITFMMIGVVTGLLGFAGIAQIRNAGRITKDTYDGPLMAINYARSAQTTFEQLGNTALDTKRATLASANGGNLAQSMLDDLDVTEKRVSSPAAIKLVQHVRALSLRWIEMRKHLSRGAQSSNERSIQNLALSDELRDAFERLSEQMATDGFVQRRLAVSASKVALHTSIIATSIALVLSLLMGLVMSRRIVRPITSAASVANRIAAGDLETPIPAGSQDEAGTLLSSMAFMQEKILERRRSSEDRLIAAMESSSEAMLLLDAAGHVLISNSRVTSLLETFMIDLKAGIAFTDAFPSFAACWASRLQKPGELELPDGKWINISQQETSEGGSFLILSDVTLRKSHERKLEIAAYIDSLTQIRNRTYLIDCFDKETVAQDGFYHRLLLVLDIDRFRLINTRLGARAADQVLIGLAQRLRRIVGDDDVCARIGGNEFAIYVPHADQEELTRLIECLQTLRTKPWRIAGQEVSLQISAGISMAENQTTSGGDLLYEARSALDKAKQQGGGRTQVFGADLRREARSRLIIQQDLPEALREKRIYIEYQPIISLGTGLTNGLEALVRWRHTELGQIPPMQFVNVAEETGAIIELGEFVLEQAAECTVRWVNEHALGDAFTTAVNLSPCQIADPRNARRILTFLDQHQNLARHIKLEITEGVLLDNPAAMASLLGEFKLRGVQLSLDDFGTGYSSLSYLHKFSFDILKIDRSFVIRMEESADALRLVKTIIELSHDLGMKTVAEGVETERQAQYLRDLGSDYGQGYLFSKPLPGMKIPGFLSKDSLCESIEAA